MKLLHKIYLTVWLIFTFLLMFLIYQMQIEINDLKRNKEIIYESGIVIGDTTMHVIRNFKIQGNNSKFLEVKRIKNGVNNYSFILSPNLKLKLLIKK